MSMRYPAPDSTPRHSGPIEQGTIRLLSGLLPGSLVLFTAAHTGRKGGLTLLPVLLRALGRLDPRWRISSEENPPVLRKTTLGCPRLLLGNQQGPSVSFSHGEGRIWAAVSNKGSVGIDVASPEEFHDSYPFARAFNPEEREVTMAICPGDTARGAALLWSVKEAAVKAIGVGFNRLDPLDVRVKPPIFREKGFLFEVLTDRSVWVWASAEEKAWLSVALTRSGSVQ